MYETCIDMTGDVNQLQVIGNYIKIVLFTKESNVKYCTIVGAKQEKGKWTGYFLKYGFWIGYFYKKNFWIGKLCIFFWIGIFYKKFLFSLKFLKYFSWIWNLKKIFLEYESSIKIFFKSENSIKVFLGFFFNMKLWQFFSAFLKFY